LVNRDLINPTKTALVLLLVLHACRVGAGEVTVAVAANFRAPMELIARSFEQQSGHRTTLVYGSSGKFFAQIRQGAPFDLFLSADQVKPLALIEAGLAEPSARITYATGALALWSPDSDRVDAQGRVTKLLSESRTAIANPLLAPYGAAAMEVITGLGLNKPLRLVHGENVAQAYQFASSGNADLGFVARSQVLDNGVLRSGSAWLVPTHLHAPIRQDAVLLNRSRHKPPAVALLNFLQSERTIRIIDSFGYQVEPESRGGG
jgi:molybdate transport system substrate-binding protein